jgi:hypothetical protein
MSVAQTILDQLRHTASHIGVIWSWGASAYRSFDAKALPGLGSHMGGLFFRVRGALFQGQVFIALHPSDTYTICFGSLRAGKLTIKHKVEGVHFDEMVDIIDKYVETPSS